MSIPISPTSLIFKGLGISFLHSLWPIFSLSGKILSQKYLTAAQYLFHRRFQSAWKVHKMAGDFVKQITNASNNLLESFLYILTILWATLVFWPWKCRIPVTDYILTCVSQTCKDPALQLLRTVSVRTMANIWNGYQMTSKRQISSKFPISFEILNCNTSFY